MYVIRSMSTTDASYGRKPEPFHTYLMMEHLRTFAYWSTCKLRAATFETVEEALKHGLKVLGEEKRFDVVPKDDSDVMPYWEIRDVNWHARLIGSEIRLHQDIISRRSVLVEEIREFAEWGPISTQARA